MTGKKEAEVEERHRSGSHSTASTAEAHGSLVQDTNISSLLLKPDTKRSKSDVSVERWKATPQTGSNNLLLQLTETVGEAGETGCIIGRHLWYPPTPRNLPYKAKRRLNRWNYVLSEYGKTLNPESCDSTAVVWKKVFTLFSKKQNTHIHCSYWQCNPEGRGYMCICCIFQLNSGGALMSTGREEGEEGRDLNQRHVTWPWYHGSVAMITMVSTGRETQAW